MGTAAPVISTPNGNGRRWWQEVWGKVTAGAILLVVSGVLIWGWGKVTAAAAATVEVYALPPQVYQLRKDVNELQHRPPMPQAEVDKLAQAIAKAMKEQRTRDATR